MATSSKAGRCNEVRIVVARQSRRRDAMELAVTRLPNGCDVRVS